MLAVELSASNTFSAVGDKLEVDVQRTDQGSMESWRGIKAVS